MTIIDNDEVAGVFKAYPEQMRKNLMFLRQLVLDTASETNGVGVVEETLKWGEPSYVTKGGSTVRINWKNSNPHQYGIYFICSTKLVDTFKELYRDIFNFEGSRAILFHETDEIPVDELKDCISLALTYHSRKHLPLLGA